MALLDMPFVAALRRNHALEHATMHILGQRQPYLNAVARTALDGFYVYGMVDTRALADTASEGLARLQAGETDLAVHPRCGTNLAVAGLLAGLLPALRPGRHVGRDRRSATGPHDSATRHYLLRCCWPEYKDRYQASRGKVHHPQSRVRALFLSLPGWSLRVLSIPRQGYVLMLARVGEHEGQVG
jgi:hypothetical protein